MATSSEDLAIDLAFRDLDMARATMARTANATASIAGILITLDAILIARLVENGSNGQVATGVVAVVAFVAGLTLFALSWSARSLGSADIAQKLTGTSAGSVRDEKEELAEQLSQQAKGLWAAHGRASIWSVILIGLGVMVVAWLTVMVAQVPAKGTAPATSASPTPIEAPTRRHISPPPGSPKSQPSQSPSGLPSDPEGQSASTDA